MLHRTFNTTDDTVCTCIVYVCVCVYAVVVRSTCGSVFHEKHRHGSACLSREGCQKWASLLFTTKLT